jgi:3(or 17)beta-hydroxysteroid dehydrogenase
MLGCKHAIGAMKDNPGGPYGSIVNVSSITGYIGLANGAAYTASKGGVRLLTKSVAVHCARTYKKIRCNSVHPGAIDTPMNQAAFEASGDADAMRTFFSALQPIGRMTSPDEIADACLYLASDDSSSVTGAEILVDGGWLAASSPL